MTGQPDAPDVLERFNANLDLVEILARQVGRAVGRATELDDLLAYLQALKASVPRARS